MKNQLINSLNRNGLFVKMFVVMFVSIVTVSILITYTTIRMSERLFIDTFSITNTKVLDQITSYFEGFSYSVTSVVNQVQQSSVIKNFLTDPETQPIELAKANHLIKKQLERYEAMIDQDAVNIVIYGENERLFSTNYVVWPVTAEDLGQHPVTLNSYKDPNRIWYQFDHRDIDNPIMYDDTIVISKALIEHDHIYGMLYITIRENDFENFYTNNTGNGNDIFLLDSEGIIVSSNQKPYTGQELKELLGDVKEIEDKHLSYKQIDVFGEQRLLLSQYLPTYDMYLVNLIDRESVLANLVNKKVIFLISAGIVALALLIMFLISRKITKSLSHLVQQISVMGKKNFNTYVRETGSYETKQLARAFNYMLDELHEYVDELMITQKKQRNAELEALQQQINPHFLYNTLASVKFMVQEGDREKSANTINALISLLQNTIGNVSETNTIEQELEHVKSYVYINQIRYGDRIHVNYFVSPDCLNIEVPKLILQPFIENAFFHAFNKKRDGVIQILISRKNQYLLCEIMDNGDGMEEQSKAQGKKNKRQLFSGIGIRNVQERIQLLYGSQYGVKVSSQIGEGTKISLFLPAGENKNNPNF